jgi:hypothetical protein
MSAKLQYNGFIFVSSGPEGNRSPEPEMLQLKTIPSKSTEDGLNANIWEPLSGKLGTKEFQDLGIFWILGPLAINILPEKCLKFNKGSQNYHFCQQNRLTVFLASSRKVNSFTHLGEEKIPDIRNFRIWGFRIRGSILYFDMMPTSQLNNTDYIYFMSHVICFRQVAKRALGGHGVFTIAIASKVSYC